MEIEIVWSNRLVHHARSCATIQRLEVDLFDHAIQACVRTHTFLHHSAHIRPLPSIKKTTPSHFSHSISLPHLSLEVEDVQGGGGHPSLRGPVSSASCASGGRGEVGVAEQFEIFLRLHLIGAQTHTYMANGR